MLDKFKSKFKSKYTGLWLILSVALLIIAFISFIDDVSFFGMKIKKSPIAEKLTNQYLSTEEKEKIEKNKKAELAAKAKPQVNPVDTNPQVFLFFGDSMTENLAVRGAAYAKQNGHKIYTVNWDSSGTRIWSQCDTLDQYIKKYEPTFIFISLGSNELYIRDVGPYREYVQTIIKKIGNIPYIWIGPPNWKPDQGINDMLMDENKPGTFFLTNGMELPRRKDNIHPTREGGAMWFDSIVRWMPKSAHPIRMKVPVDSISESVKLSDTNIIYLKAQH